MTSEKENLEKILGSLIENIPKKSVNTSGYDSRQYYYFGKDFTVKLNSHHDGYSEDVLNIYPKKGKTISFEKNNDGEYEYYDYSKSDEDSIPIEPAIKGYKHIGLLKNVAKEVENRIIPIDNKGNLNKDIVKEWDAHDLFYAFSLLENSWQRKLALARRYDCYTEPWKGYKDWSKSEDGYIHKPSKVEIGCLNKERELTEKEKSCGLTEALIPVYYRTWNPASYRKITDSFELYKADELEITSHRVGNCDPDPERFEG